MSGHHYFGVLLVICAWSLSYSFRLLEGPDNFKTCPAPVREPLYDEQHDQHRNFYNVHEVPRKPSSNINELKSENWLMRIIKIKTFKQNTIHDDSGMDQKPHMDGWMKRLLSILSSRREDTSPLNKNEHKIFFILKKHPHHTDEHHIAKRELIPNSFM